MSPKSPPPRPRRVVLIHTTDTHTRRPFRPVNPLEGGGEEAPPCDPFFPPFLATVPYPTHLHLCAHARTRTTRAGVRGRHHGQAHKSRALVHYRSRLSRAQRISTISGASCTGGRTAYRVGRPRPRGRGQSTQMGGIDRIPSGDAGDRTLALASSYLSVGRSRLQRLFRGRLPEPPPLQRRSVLSRTSDPVRPLSELETNKHGIPGKEHVVI